MSLYEEIGAKLAQYFAVYEDKILLTEIQKIPENGCEAVAQLTIIDEMRNRHPQRHEAFKKWVEKQEKYPATSITKAFEWFMSNESGTPIPSFLKGE